MRAWLSSPRRQRRLAVAAFVLLAGAVALGVGWLGRDSGRDYGDTSVRASGPAVRAPAPAQDAEVPFTEAVREAVLPVASRFVATAVDRKHLDEAWQLAHPELKAGYTLREWRTGEIPVVPYPVGGARWDVQYSLENEVGLYVLLEPRAGEEVPATTFLIALKRARAGAPWLVSAWAPSAGGVYAAAREGASRPLAAVEPGGAFDQGELSALWLALPVAGTLGIVLAAGVFFVARGWRRNRRAAALYGKKELPPLPSRYTSAS